MGLHGELVRFPASDGLGLEGFLHEAPGRTALVFVHGMTDVGWSPPGPTVFELARAAGVAALLVNTRGAGIVTEFGYPDEPDRDTIAAGTAFERFADGVRDLDGAVEFLGSRGFDRLVLVGHSTGCQKVVADQLEAARPEVEGLVLLAPVDDRAVWQRSLGASFESVLADARDRGDAAVLDLDGPTGYLSPRRFVALVEPGSAEGDLFDYGTELDHLRDVDVPMLTVFGRDEPFAARPVDELLARIAAESADPRSRTAVVPGDHAFRGGEAELAAAVTRFLTDLDLLPTGAEPAG